MKQFPALPVYIDKRNRHEQIRRMCMLKKLKTAFIRTAVKAENKLGTICVKVREAHSGEMYVDTAAFSLLR
jgi:hypothetical protein